MVSLLVILRTLNSAGVAFLGGVVVAVVLC